MRDDVAGPDGSALSEGLGAGAEARCWCRACERKTAAAAIGRGDFFGLMPRFIVCPHCGDKRCLHAWSHDAPCAKADLYAHNAWVERIALRANPPPADLRCCANCAHWHKKEYIHCQCSGPWGGNVFGDKNCTFRARSVND